MPPSSVESISEGIGPSWSKYAAVSRVVTASARSTRRGAHAPAVTTAACTSSEPELVLDPHAGAVLGDGRHRRLLEKPATTVRDRAGERRERLVREHDPTLRLQERLFAWREHEAEAPLRRVAVEDDVLHRARLERARGSGANRRGRSSRTARAASRRTPPPARARAAAPPAPAAPTPPPGRRGGRCARSRGSSRARGRARTARARRRHAPHAVSARAVASPITPAPTTAISASIARA